LKSHTFSQCRQFIGSKYPLYVMAGSFFLISLVLCVFRYLSLNSHIYDLGLFDNVFWNFSSGNGLYSDILHKHFLSHHFMPILYLFSLPYFLGIGGPIYLILIQSTAIALSIYFLGVCLNTVFDMPWKHINLFCFIYTLSPSVHNASFYDFHPESFLPLLYMLLLIFIKKKSSIIWTVICLILLLSIKENIGISVAAIGTCLLFYKPLRKRGILLIFVGVTVGILMGFLGETIGFRNDFICRYDWLGDTGLQMLTTLFQNPGEVIQRTLINNSGLEYLFTLFLPVLFICFINPKWLLPAIPVIIINLFGGFPCGHLMSFYYQIDITIWIIIASALAWIKTVSAPLSKHSRIYRTIIIAMIFFSVLSMHNLSRMYPFSKVFKADKFNFQSLESGLRLKRWAKTNLSENDSVSVVGSIVFPEITHLAGYSLFPEKWVSSDYVIIDKQRLHWIPEQIVNSNLIIDRIEKSRDWSRIILDDRIIIFVCCR